MTRIRHARPDDHAALRAIQSATLAEAWPDLLQLGVHGQPTLLVAEDRPPLADGRDPSGSAGLGTPVGYALAVTGDEERVGYLVELAVAPDVQGEGHGSALLSTLVDLFREKGLDRLRVTVREIDDRAREFYRTRGFERRAYLSDHYDDCGGYLFVRDLD